MICPNCGRELDEEWRACPGCGADLRDRTTAAETIRMPVQPKPPAPTTPRPGQPVYNPQRQHTAVTPPDQYPPGSQYPSAYPTQQYYQKQVDPYSQAGVRVAPGGSVLLGLLTMLCGGVVMAATFFQWITAGQVAGYSLNITGWSVMRSGLQEFAGGGLKIVLTGDGTIFFTGFLSLLLGALILLAGVVTMLRRRPGGILALLLALAACAVSAINVAMVFAKMEGASTGIGLWAFAAASFVALALGVVSLSSSG